MSKVLHLLDYENHLTFKHYCWLEEQIEHQMTVNREALIREMENENITDNDRTLRPPDKYENYINPDGDTHVDDVPF